MKTDDVSWNAWRACRGPGQAVVGALPRYTSSGARRSVEGFTLIEIMIVIGIVAMILVMGMPSIIQSVRKDPLRQAVSDLMEGCSYARAQAILQGFPQELVIRAVDGHFTVRRVPINATGSSGESPIETPGATPAPAPFSARLHEDIAVILLDVNFRDQMEAEESHVRFYPNGISDEFTIVVETPYGRRKISLECVTGLADVEVLR
ncbi:MAG TPA: prepilin-type N-terminal cleavage/methylation domain-containing protein [Verrucomicrobiae bacterium]|nr:prepilin-type N-terminal cleavage/methylation domain-containing protein [Verrucomicrobiae bacterium]